MHTSPACTRLCASSPRLLAYRGVLSSISFPMGTMGLHSRFVHAVACPCCRPAKRFGCSLLDEAMQSPYSPSKDALNHMQRAANLSSRTASTAARALQHLLSAAHGVFDTYISMRVIQSCSLSWPRRRVQCAATQFWPAATPVVRCSQETASGNCDMSRSVNEARLLHCVDMLLLRERRAHDLVEELHRLHSAAVQELRTISAKVSVQKLKRHLLKIGSSAVSVHR